MHESVINQLFSCPYCGEKIETLIDTSQGSHQTIEDCYVCCQPIELNINIDDVNHQINLTAHSDTE